VLPLHDSRTTSDGITYNLITTPEQLADVQDVYSAEDEFTYDVETIGEHRGDTVRNDIVWLSMACGEPRNVRTDVIPMGHPNGELLRIDYPILNSGLKRRAAGLEVRPQDYSKAANKGVKVFSPPPVQLSPGEVWGTLKPLFTSEQTKIGHGLKFDLVSAAKYLQGEIPSPPYADTLVMASILDNRHHFHLGLDDCSARELKYHMVKGLGKNVALATFSDTADYSAIDANKTHLLKHKYAPKIKRDHLTGIFNLEMDLLEVLADMELEGAPVDIPALQVLYDRLAAEIEVAEARVFAAAGRAFNMNSNPEKQNLLYAPKAEGGQGLRPRGLTDTGKIAAEKGEPITIRHYSTDSDALEPYRGKNRLVDEMLAYTELDKLQSTYVIPYLGGEVTHTTGGKSKTTVKDSMLIKGRIHTDFVQYGAETGRMSCVSGDTLLLTSRGVFRFDEYLPVEGDHVVTHMGRLRPVLRKIYKGVDQMVRLVLENGAVLTCTRDHKLLTSRGAWVRVGDLAVGDRMATPYVSVEAVRSGPGEPASGAPGVHGTGEAHHGDAGQVAGGHARDRDRHPGPGVDPRAAQGGEGTAVLTFQDGAQEPYAGQEWFPAPQLQGSDPGREWVPAGQGEREVRTAAPLGDGGAAGAGGPAIEPGRPPHRQGPAEQLPGQPGAGDEAGSPDAAQPVDVRGSSRLVEITPVGAMGVWDIEVAGDHSYAAHGFLNHNSRHPNLQNVPNPKKSENGLLIRNLFIAPEGFSLVQADYSQIEPRIIASFSKDRALIHNYLTGGDVYVLVGDSMSVDRAAGKVLVLAISYGIGPDHIAKDIGCTSTAARDLMNRFNRNFPSIEAYKRQVIQEARLKSPVPYVTTLLGRRRYLPLLRSTDYKEKSGAERQCFNTKIQGTGADIIKLAMVRAHRLIPEGARMILTVHDEIVILTPNHLIDETSEALREAMEGINVLSVPLTADIHVVTKWGDAK
jgi:DNA polymerase I-like protein with 3'-5' exonuclease and polymerase domains